MAPQADAPGSGAVHQHAAVRVLEAALAQTVPPILPRQIQVEGQGFEDLSAELQGLAPDKETRRAHREVLSIDLEAGVVAYERHTPRNDESLRWRRFILLPDARGWVDLTTGRGSLRPSAVPDVERAGYRRRVPHLLLTEVARQPAGLRALGAVTWHDTTHQAIAAPLPTGEQLTLLFDEDSLLARVEYLVHLPGLGDTLVGMEYPDWTRHDRLERFPTGHRLTVGDRVLQEVTYSRVLIDDPAIGRAFAVSPPASSAAPAAVPAAPAATKAGASTPIPSSSPASSMRAESAPAARRDPTSTAAGPSPAPPPSVPPAAGVSMVAEGTYLIEDLAGFDLLFVDLGTEVLAAEAPEAATFLDTIPARVASAERGVSRAFIDAIHRTLPGKPLRYVVLSHHHGDHAGGVREFLAEGATVLAPPSDVPFVLRLASAPHTVRRDALSPADGLSRGWAGPSEATRAARPDVDGVTGRRIVRGDAREVAILQVGPNPHTDDSLVVWVP
jgi:glyoxylase-like metal-dependent hydrolase (beta-lactamase superfamily II)